MLLAESQASISQVLSDGIKTWIPASAGMTVTRIHLNPKFQPNLRPAPGSR